eukprot:370370_1
MAVPWAPSDPNCTLLLQLLQTSIDPAHASIPPVEVHRQLDALRQNEPAPCVYLTQIFVSHDPNLTDRIREVAGLYLKQLVNGGELDVTGKWSTEIQKFVMQTIIGTLSDPEALIRRIGATCIG